jgi:proline iminopeptidase
VSPREGFVTARDGVRLFFQQVGNGPEVVLIPNGIYLADDFARFAAGRTLVFYDLRNRGRSEAVQDLSETVNVIEDDVDDLEAVRRHTASTQVAVVGHSYVGLTAVMYAMKYPAHASRVLQIGSIGPFPEKEYPPEFSGHDDTRRRILSGLAELERERESLDPLAFCRKFWSTLRALYVADPADADKIVKWERCDVPNELNLMPYFVGHIMPSIQRIRLTRDDFNKVRAPVLTVHGVQDRSAPYGGGREWALVLPDARLLTVARAAHAPWIEAPDQVLPAIETFLGGAWPEGAEIVTAIE